jgi:AcrR family transcriptional regulator
MARSAAEAANGGGAPAGRSGRRNRDAEIIDAAIEVFSRKGFAAASMQDVADAVGLLKGSLYHYISSKEEMLFRIFDESHRQGSAIMEEVAALDLPPLDRLHAYFARYVHWYLDNVERVSLYFKEWRYLEGERRKTVVDQGRIYARFVRGLIEEAQAAGDVDPSVDAKLASFYIMGAVNAVPDWYHRDGRYSAATIARRYADLSVHVLTGSLPAR